LPRCYDAPAIIEAEQLAAGAIVGLRKLSRLRPFSMKALHEQGLEPPPAREQRTPSPANDSSLHLGAVILRGCLDLDPGTPEVLLCRIAQSRRILTW
jgi:hypothetical protein